MGIDTFTYTLTDGFASATATCSITLVNDAPVGSDANYSTPMNRMLTATPPIGLLSGFADVDPLHISKINDQTLVNGSITFTTSNGGVITVYADGSFEYTPAADLEYLDTLTFNASDGIDEVTKSLYIMVGSVDWS